jgi:hypothetical protein
VIVAGNTDETPVKYCAPHAAVEPKLTMVTPALSVTVAVYVPAEYVWVSDILVVVVSPHATVAPPEEDSPTGRGPMIAPAGIVNVNSIYIRKLF